MLTKLKGKHSVSELVGWYSINLLEKDERLSWPLWLIAYQLAHKSYSYLSTRSSSLSNALAIWLHKNLLNPNIE